MLPRGHSQRLKKKAPRQCEKCKKRGRLCDGRQPCSECVALRCSKACRFVAHRAQNDDAVVEQPSEAGEEDLVSRKRGRSVKAVDEEEEEEEEEELPNGAQKRSWHIDDRLPDCLCQENFQHAVVDSDVCDVCGSHASRKCPVCNVYLGFKTSFRSHEKSILHSLCSKEGEPLRFRCSSGSEKHVRFDPLDEDCETCHEPIEYMCPLCGVWLKNISRTFGPHFGVVHAEADRPLRDRPVAQREIVDSPADKEDWAPPDDEDEFDDEEEESDESLVSADLVDELEPGQRPRHFSKNFGAVADVLPSMFLNEAIDKVMEHSYGRVVRFVWIAQSLKRSGWQARFGDFCDAKLSFDPARCTSTELLVDLVRASCLSKRPSMVITTRFKNEVYVSVLNDDNADYLSRHDLEELFDQLSPVKDGARGLRIENPDLEKRFSKHQVGASMLDDWRKGDAQFRHAHAFPTELAIDTVARSLRVSFRGRVLKLVSDTGKAGRELIGSLDAEGDADLALDFGAADGDGIDAKDSPDAMLCSTESGSLEIRSHRRLFVVWIAAEDRDHGAEASILRLIESIHFNAESATFALCIVALYRRLIMIPRALAVLQAQFFAAAMAESHCDQEQMIQFGSYLCQMGAVYGCSFAPDSLPGLIVWQKDVGIASFSGPAEIALYRHFGRGKGDKSLLLLGEGRHYVSLGGEDSAKYPPTRFFFRARLPLPATESSFSCLYSTLNVIGFGPEESLLVMVMGTTRVRLMLSSDVPALKRNEVDRSTRLALERWNDRGAVLVLHNGFLMGQGILTAHRSGQSGQMKMLELQIFVDEVLAARTTLQITTKFLAKDAVESLSLDTPWAPQKLLELAARPVDSEMVRVDSRAGEATRPIVFASVGRFLMNVAWLMRFGSGHPDEANKPPLRLDDFVNFSAALQHRMEQECFAIAADMLELENVDEEQSAVQRTAYQTKHHK